MLCSVYIICQDGLKPPTKIGISIGVKERFSSIQGSNPNKLEFYKYFTYRSMSFAQKIERKVHSALKKNRIRGEWFDVAPEEAEKVIFAVSEAMDQTHTNQEHTMLGKQEFACLEFIGSYIERNGSIPILGIVGKEIGAPLRRVEAIIGSLYKKGYISVDVNEYGNPSKLKIIPVHNS